MSPETVQELLREGRIERVPADDESGQSMLEEAQRHLFSAETIMVLDASGAYSLIYDAARKAVSGHMLAKGFRAASGRPGGHAAVVAYASATFRGAGVTDVIKGFDRMRRTRHRVEYDAAIVGEAQLTGDLEAARKIVDLVVQSWPARSGPGSSRRG